MADKKDLLLGAVTLPREVVDVPELGTSFTIQGMSGTQRDAYEASLFVPTANGIRRVLSLVNVRAKLLVHTIVDDETGQPLFTENDTAALGQVSAAVLDRLFTVAQRLSGLRQQDVEDLAKK